MTEEQNRILLIVRANIRGAEKWPFQTLDVVNQAKRGREALEQLTALFEGRIERKDLGPEAWEYMSRNWDTTGT
jgi:hypothetical protein